MTAPRLSDRYEKLYSALLDHLGQRYSELPEKVCFHWPLRQPTYSGRLLVIGQALNRWMVDGPSQSLVIPAARADYVARTRAQSEAAGAWSWMGRRPWVSPFWKVARAAMDRLDANLHEIAWSNLAKVSPASGGNPQGVLLNEQHGIGGELLALEIRELDPALVLVISGRGWTEPFLSSARVAPQWNRNGARHFDGILDGRRWLIVSHPGTFAHRLRTSIGAVEEALDRGLDQ